MRTLDVMLIIFSGISFVIYGRQVLFSNQMSQEFERFGLQKFHKLTGILQLLGGLGLILGLLIKLKWLLMFSSLGLAMLMLFGFGVRIKMKDGLWLSLPSLFYTLINFYISAVVLEIW